MGSDLPDNKWRLVDKRSNVYWRPGIYAIFYKKNSKKICAYIGRSKNLYNRVVCSHRGHPVLLRIKHRFGKENVSIKIKHTSDLSLEYKLIKKLQPQFNIYGKGAGARSKANKLQLVYDKFSG